MSSSHHHEINGVRLRVDVSGEGEPLVLVHGSWDSRHIWTAVERELAGRFRVITYDRCGHTDSEDRAAPDARRDDEDDLAGLIESVAGGAAHVVGNSFGGSIALGLACRRPELFLSLAAHEPPLMSLAPGMGASGFEEAVAPVLAHVDRGDNAAAAAEFTGIVVGPGAWEATPADAQEALAVNAPTFAGEVKDPDWADIDLDALEDAGTPILLTHGDESPPFFGQIVEAIAARVAGATLRTLPGAGHIPHLTDPEAYTGVVAKFASDAARTAGAR